VANEQLAILLEEAALNQGRVPHAVNLLRSLLQAPPEVLRNFFGQVTVRFDGDLGANLTDSQARACMTDLVMGVPEILYFLPLDCMVFAVSQSAPTTVLISDTARKGVVSLDLADIKRELRPLLRGLKTAMAKAGFSDESYLRHTDNIFDLFGVPKEGRNRLLP
jgi:hypothetical protein